MTLLTTAWLLLGPRVELFGVAQSSVRVEDLLLVLLAIHVASRWRTVRESMMIRPGIALVVLVSLAAALVGTLHGRVDPLPSLLYALRPLEYWVIYPALALTFATDAARATYWLPRLLAFATWVEAGTAALQYVGGVSIGFSSFTNARGAGLTAGPYELGAIGAILGCYWVAKRRPSLVILATLAVLMSQSRISLIGLAVGATIAWIWRPQHTRLPRVRRLPEALPVVAATVLLAVGIAASPLILAKVISPSIDRVQETSLQDAWHEASTVSSMTSRTANSSRYAVTAYDAIGQSVVRDSNSSDVSNVVRFYRWQLLLREAGQSPETVALGLGPSFAGASVDGNYVRIFGETGLIGVAAWVLMLFRWLRRTPSWFIGAALSLMIGALFIDLFVAMRPMILLWALLALAAHTHQRPDAPPPGGSRNAIGSHSQ